MTILASEGSALRARLETMVAPARRCLVMVGVPGVGKSLWAQQAALIAIARGRSVTLLQWDVVRQPLEQPPYDERFPEVDGVTHPAIRLAVNAWTRGAVARWHATAPDDALLICETSLTEARLTDLANPINDGAEPLLSGETTLFVAPTPTAALREQISRQRERDSAEPRHENDRGSAPMNVLEESWRALQLHGDPSTGATTGFDPDRYVAIYARLLRHRHFERLDINDAFTVPGSAFDLPSSIERLEIEPDEVESVITPFAVASRQELESSIPFLGAWY